MLSAPVKETVRCLDVPCSQLLPKGERLDLCAFYDRYDSLREFQTQAERRDAKANCVFVSEVWAAEESKVFSGFTWDD